MPANTYDHCHNVNGAFITLNQTQDAEAPKCADCGRTADADTQPHNHALNCPTYRPHPHSIAANHTESHAGGSHDSQSR